MFFRTLALAGGIAGSVSLSQFPEFSQQYLQRLGGAVDELSSTVEAVDKSAAETGSTREEVLEEQVEGHLRDALTAQVRRYERLSADYEALVSARPAMRLLQIWRYTDAEIARRVWSDFQPALPLTLEGALCGLVGFVSGWFLLWGILTPVRRWTAA